MAIELVPHDPVWAAVYERAALDIKHSLGSVALSVDHVGSTAIPGIIAKPVIDVLIVVADYDPEERYRRPLESLGYAFDHRDEIHVLFKGAPQGVPFHVHVVAEASQDARMMTVFRDRLRADPGEARRYEELKRRLAEEYDDATAYSNAKSSYVWEIVRRS